MHFPAPPEVRIQNTDVKRLDGLRRTVAPGARNAGVDNGQHSNHPRDSGLDAVARGITLTLGGSFASVGLGFVLTVLVTRGFGAAGAGVFFIAISILAIASAIAAVGANDGAVKFVAHYKALGRLSEVRTIVLVAVVPVLGVSVMLTVLGVAFSEPIGELFVAPGDTVDVSSAVRVLMPVLPLSALSAVFVGASRGLGTMRPYFVTEQIAKPVARVVGVGAVLAVGGGLTAALVSWATALALGAVASGMWLLRLVRAAEERRAGLERGRAFDRALEFWKFSAIRGLASVFKVVVEWLDVILVGALASAEEAGIYAAITRLVRVGGIAQRATVLAVAPRISALFAVNDRAQLKTLYRVSTTWLVAFSFPVYLVLAFFSPTIVQIFGEDFTPGALPLSILALAMLVNMASGPGTMLLLMAGKASWNLGNTVVSLVINVTLNLLLIPSFGITGAAIAWMASILFDNLVPAFQNWYAFRVHPIGLGLVLAAVGAIASFGTAGLLAFVWTGTTATFVLVTAAVIVYGGVMWRWRDLLSFSTIREAVRLRRPKASPLVGAP